MVCENIKKQKKYINIVKVYKKPSNIYKKSSKII